MTIDRSAHGPRIPRALRIPSYLVSGALACATLPAAQSNAIPGTDVELASISSVSAFGRTGVFPNGLNGCGMSTTICNKGSVQVPWQAPMADNHPYITFLMARESDGVFEQISDWSYVKHGFAALASSFCDTCQPPGTASLLGIGCSDTYSSGLNADNYWLGPPSEIDPWLGLWNPVCSHFDRGEPAVAPPADCDGVRSLSSSQAAALGPVGHRITVSDADFDVPGASFYYQGYYVVRGEPEAARTNNMATRGMNVSWTGSSWAISATGTHELGSILERWDGAGIASTKNGDDDGRVYVGTRVFQLENGLYRYVYAIHNRDNARGIGEVRIPICPGATITNASFHDVDRDPVSDWTLSLSPAQDAIRFTDTLGSNPLTWNTIFTVRFDSDAAPSADTLELDQAAPGPGLATLTLAVSTPGSLHTQLLGAGCSFSSPGTLFAGGPNPAPKLGNPDFEIHSTGNSLGTAHLLVYGTSGVSLPLGSCTLWTGLPIGNLGVALVDGSGRAVHSLPIPFDVSLEGLEIDLQGALLATPSPASPFFELGAGLRVRLGNSVPDCP